MGHPRLTVLSFNDIFIANGPHNLQRLSSGSRTEFSEVFRASLANSERKSLYKLALDGLELRQTGVIILCGALGITTGNAILFSRLRSEVPRDRAIISPGAVIRNGALNMQSLSSPSSALHGLREYYAIAISHVDIL